MINDNDKFDDIIRNAAQDYNRPPSIVPKDDMWAAIQSAQAERVRRPLHIVPAAPRTSIRRYAWISAAAAAVLMLGIGIGRMSTIPHLAPGAPQPAARAPLAANSNPSPGTQSQEPQAIVTNPASTEEPTARVGQAIPRGSERVSRGGQRIAASGQPTTVSGMQVAGRGAPTAGRGALGAGYAAPDASVTYQVATVRHLSNAEALLTAFRNDSRDAKMDASLSKWARDLLANTRLLLDSPAADDPQRARLLGDLELVLAEIVQLSPGASADDRSLIEGSIQNGHVLTRLRYAIPAGQRGL